MKSRTFSCSRLLPMIALIAWVTLNFFVAYRCRYWINSDTVGTLDAARALGSSDWLNGLNGYFGVGFAFFLAPLDLKAPDSFLGVHIINVFLLLGAQLFLYGALRNLNVSRWVSALTIFVWAGSCYATGCAIYMTADTTLCFWSSVFVYWVTRHTSQPIDRPIFGALLGVLHAVAGMTKAVAFPTLLIFPLAYGAFWCWRGWSEHAESKVTLYKRLTGFLLLYFIPFSLVSAGWGMACKERYGHFTLGGTATFNYERYTRKSATLLSAIEAAERRLPISQSFWWSDPSRSVTGWAQKVHVNLADQIRAVAENSRRYLKVGTQSFSAGPALAIVAAAFLSLLLLLRHAAIGMALALGAAGWVSVFLYLNVVLIPRHLTFPALLCLPLAAMVVDQWLKSPRGWVRGLVTLALFAAIGHGIVAMVYAAEFLAPGPYHFQVAATIREHSPDGPIGVSIDAKLGPRSYGIIAFLAETQAAEITSVGDQGNAYRAEFEPQTVLVIDRGDGEIHDTLTVNGRRFELLQTGSWEAGRTWPEEHITTYLSQDR